MWHPGGFEMGAAEMSPTVVQEGIEHGEGSAAAEHRSDEYRTLQAQEPAPRSQRSERPVTEARDRLCSDAQEGGTDPPPEQAFHRWHSAWSFRAVPAHSSALVPTKARAGPRRRPRRRSRW